MLLRHLLSILMLPTMVALVFPWWLLTTQGATDTRWMTGGLAGIVARLLGVAFLVTGVALVIWCIALFARVGKGTLAPWDPTKALVAEGPYRYARNPMITGVITTLSGEALWTGSRYVGLWALTVFAINHVYFVTIEEPGLVERFGEPYRQYMRAVPRWIPRRPQAPL